MGMTETKTIVDPWHDRDKITGQPIGKTLISLAVPAVLSTFFTVVFEIIDMFWIGKLGSVSIAALSASSFFVWMLRGLGITIATGAIAMVARRAGERNEEGLLSTVIQAIGSSFAFSIAMMVVFFPLSMYSFQWLGLEPGVAGFAREYAVVFLSGLVFVYLMMTLEYVIRGIGDTKLPMIITGVSLFLNAVMDPVFIFVFDMGLMGAAYATIFAQAVGTLLMGLALFKKIPKLKRIARKKGSGLHRGFWERFFRMVKIGGPVGISDAGFSFIYLLLTWIIAYFGKESLGAIGIAHRLEALPFFICLGFSMAVAPMVGQYLGAGMLDHAKKSVFLSLKITVVIMAGIAVVYVLFAPHLFRFFTDDAGIVAYGAQYIRIVILSDIFLPLEVILSGAFSGAGDTKPPLYITFPITSLRVPMAYFLAITLGMGPTAIWLTIGVTTFLKGFLLLLAFNKGKWAQKKI
jgi:putative MATE family efflux protein